MPVEVGPIRCGMGTGCGPTTNQKKKKRQEKTKMVAAGALAPSAVFHPDPDVILETGNRLALFV